MKIGIVTTTIREGRKGIDIANWVLEEAQKRNLKVNFELIDLKDYDLPMLGAANATKEQLGAIGTWKEKINEMDGFIFVTAEYNHAPSGVFKNALDYLSPELKNKVVSFVGYGAVGGARSIESLKMILSQLLVATTERHIYLMLHIDFENMDKFTPQAYHQASLDEMFAQTLSWTKALSTVRATE